MNILSGLAAAAVLSLSAVSLASAQHHGHGHGLHHGSSPAAAEESPGSQAPAGMSEGVVKKVDKSAGKLTIKHGELHNLGMPPMTMMFRVKDPAMLDQVKAGEKISFVVEKKGGQLTVTELLVHE